MCAIPRSAGDCSRCKDHVASVTGIMETVGAWDTGFQVEEGSDSSKTLIHESEPHTQKWLKATCIEILDFPDLQNILDDGC